MKWIKCSDRMPEKYKNVLCKIEPDEYKVTQYKKSMELLGEAPPLEEFKVAYVYDGNQGIRENCKQLRSEGMRPSLFCNPECECEPIVWRWTTGHDVTHWIAIPDGPKENE